MPTLLLATALISLFGTRTNEPDADRDGLSDFQELHKYLTDPKRADSDGDGVSDGDWQERREYNYTVRAVMHVPAPYDIPSMSDDYQDVRVLSEAGGVLEFEVVVYPFNTVADALEPDSRWSKPAAELRSYIAPGVCCNWDKAMQKELKAGLILAGVNLEQVDDIEAARAVSTYLMERAQFEDSFTTFAIDFEDDQARITPLQEANLAETLQSRGRTLAEQLKRELYGKGMFETKTRGSCTSSAIYLATGLKAAGLPTRTIVCVPIVDANDGEEVAWIDARISHHALRSTLARAAREQRGSWTSHTFNEVWIGGRWRRLNYTALGQNVLDPGGLGLMVHVHTFNDHSEAGLSGWGNREAHPLHAALLGGPNPYSCISLSDAFGVHAQVSNDPAGAGIASGEITKVYWYSDSERHYGLSTEINEGDGAGYFFAHFEVPDKTSGADARMEFWRSAGQQFLLGAPGQVDVRASVLEKCWIDLGRGVCDFLLRIEAADYAQMQPGVAYALIWPEAEQVLPWTIAKGVQLRRTP